MANDVQYLIDMLYEMIDTAKTMPMARDKCVIVREDVAGKMFGRRVWR